MPKNIDDETREILVSFIAEGYERLDDSEAQLAGVDEGDNTARLNSIFRLFHSVKGSAGYLGFENIKMLTHEAETMLDVFLKEKIPVTQDALDIMYSTIDILRKLIGITEREYSDELGETDARRQTALIASMIQVLRDSQKQKEEDVNNATQRKTNGSAKVAEVTESSESKKFTSDIPNEIFISKLVTSDMIQRFLGECSDLVDKTENIALHMNPREKAPEQINEMFRAIHTIKGNSGFFGYACLEKTCMNFESVLDKIRKENAAPGEAFINMVISHVDEIRRILNTVSIKNPPDILQKENKPSEKTEKNEEAPIQETTGISDTASSGNSSYKPLGEILVEMGAVKDESVQEALAEQERPLGEILMNKGLVAKERIEEALKIQQTQIKKEMPDMAHEVIRKEIRVDTGKLDKLFELVGELITAESMVVNSSDLVGLKLDSFAKSFASLNKISREIQETTMMIRMIPLDGLFQKMTRLVRDLSRKMDKPVNFVVSGQDTEMDKNVIEQIADPLVHILRNAIDHGIESKGKRKDAGKPETGNVFLNAKYEGSEIWISVRDDGAGLDKNKILTKAVERGILKADAVNLSDKDIWSCIFEPGFSTAEVVSDVSGRGVGLDVVKKNLEHIRGRIDIRTTPGQGTEFILAIPLTMAIIDGITVRVGTNRYSLPLNDIIEFFKVNREQVTRTECAEDTVNIRSEFLPLIKLYEVFNIQNAETDPCNGIVIVVQNNEKKACLLIDEVVGNQQIVVKSLSEYLGKVDGISGCSILGDGAVSFIIDTGRLLTMRLQ